MKEAMVKCYLGVAERRAMPGWVAVAHTHTHKGKGKVKGKWAMGPCGGLGAWGPGGMGEKEG